MSADVILAGVMQDLGGTYSAVTLEALTLWAQSEGTPPAWNNPLATTEPWPGAYDVNSAGVKAYPDVNAGIGATAATLRNGRYGPVVRAIRSNAGLQAIWSAVNASPWCAHCQGGRYPIALYDALSARGHIPQPPPGPGPPPVPAPGKGGHIDTATETAWNHFTWAGSTGTNRKIGALTASRAAIRRARR